jgi:hypothetical protein
MTAMIGSNIPFGFSDPANQDIQRYEPTTTEWEILKSDFLEKMNMQLIDFDLQEFLINDLILWIENKKGIVNSELIREWIDSDCELERIV